MTSFRSLSLLATLALGVGHAGVFVNPAAAYNVFVFQTFTETGADTGGRLAVGTNASFSGSYQIANGILSTDTSSAPNNDSLVIAGMLTGGNPQVFAGNAYVNQTSGGASVSISGGGTVTNGGASPINFAAAALSLTNESAYLATLGATNTACVNTASCPSSITFTGTQSGLNVFYVTAAQLNGNGTINVIFPAGATVVINVSGAAGGTTPNSGFTINGHPVSGNSTITDFKNVVFNYYQATALTIGGGFLGSILAPLGNVTGTGFQQVDGSLIAKSFTGNTEFHDYTFSGVLPSSVPEPAAPLFMLSGLFVVAGLLFRKNRRG